MGKNNMIGLTIQAARTYLLNRKSVQSRRANAIIRNRSSSRSQFGFKRLGTSVFGSAPSNRDTAHDATSDHIEMDDTCLEDDYWNNSFV